MEEYDLGNTYNDGDGKDDCPYCRGRGVVPVPPDKLPPYAIGEVTSPCKCVLLRDLIHNLERGWRGLSRANTIKKSPLVGKENVNLWVTGSTHNFKSHLKRVASRMGHRWDFVVVSDADLMDAWLSRDINVLDADVDQMRKAKVSGKFMALSDIAVPPKLLIIRLGVKAARNVAMPEVFLEALQLREQVSKPTWITDQPTAPLEEGHRSYSGQVEDYLEDWSHIHLKQSKAKNEKVTNQSTGIQVMTLSDDEDIDNGTRPYERKDLPSNKKGGKR